MIQCTQCIFTVVVHSVQNTSQLLVVICLDFAHSGMTKKDIENALMRGADTLRDTIDAANYKDYVLPIMFVKYLSDSYEDALDELKKEYSGIRLERQKLNMQRL